MVKDKAPAVEEKPPEGAGQGPGQVPPALPVVPSLEEPTIPKSQHTNLQRAHEEALKRIEALEGSQGRMQKLEDGVTVLSRALEMQQAEQTAATIVKYQEDGNTQAADDLADREMTRQLASMGLVWDDPRLTNVRAIRDTSKAAAYPHFLSVQPALKLAVPGSQPAPPVEAPPVEQPAGDAEKIGGKTLEELKTDWAKDAGLFTPATPPVAGLGEDVNKLPGDQILRLAVERKSEG